MKFLTRFTLLLFLFSLNGFAAWALTSSFTVDNSAGCAPLVVHFTNTSSGATSYFWDLGNGTTSTLKDVSGSYLSPGTYTVKLTAYSGGSSLTTLKTITVHPTPTVSFSASPMAACPGAPITFSSTSTGGVPGAMTYIWNFGDGFISTLPGPTHSYTDSGDYRITLTVTNAMGCVSTLSLPKFIHIHAKPRVNFAAVPSHFCSTPANAVFTNLTTGVPALTYAWSFGDGGTSVATNPPHTYALPGSYTVKLAVKDGNGCRDSLTIPAYIIVGNLTASFTLPAKSCVYSSVTFPNTSSTHVSSSWNFGDGGTSTTDTGIHAYTAPGTYTVTLIVFDGFCYDTIKHTIVINPGPVASISQSPKEPCPPPVGITFTGTVPPGGIVNWLFGDGTSGSGNPVSHTYARRGIDTIKMIVNDPATGCTDTIKKIDTLYDIDFAIIDTPSSGCKPLTVHFDLKYLTHEPDTTKSYPYPFPIVSYVWNFGDGSPVSTLAKPIHTYTAVGIYHAYVTVVSSNGCTFTDTVEILVGTPPTVTAIATPTHICYGDSIDIPITVITGPADEFFWDFGTIGSVESRGSLLHMYFPMPGVFTVTVCASYLGCKGPPFVITTPLIVDSPKAIINLTFACSPRNLVHFFNGSMGDDSHLWMFGDGTTSILDNPSHTYPTLGKYTVKLAAYNSKTGCRDTAVLEIDLTPPVFDFIADRTQICRDEIIHVTPIITVGHAYDYKWFVDGIYLDDTSHVNPYTHILRDTFFTTGFHTIKLVILDDLGCYDTLTKVNYITVAKPDAKITVAPPSGCRSLLVTFTDVSTDIPGVLFTNFKWDFGDGTTASVSTPTILHTYTANGSYVIGEIVTDAFGCKDTTSFSTVDVYKPEASFFSSNLYPCSGDSIYFTNTSIDAVSALWDFGDGTTATTFSSWHAYHSAGFFTVKLIVTDLHGCTDTAVYKDYIFISKPNASFYMSDSFSICPPLTVLFYNTSSFDAINFDWDFGDGNTSTTRYPTDVYIKPGHHIVTLIAFDANDCTDTAVGYVDIFGYPGAFTYAPLTGCAPLKVHFKSFVHDVPSIIWDFADGVTSPASTIDSINHVYTLPGSYVPKLILSDNTGCENSSMGLDTIKVNAITAAFTTEPYPVCEKGLMNFKDTSHSYFATAMSWLWTFSNGDTSTKHAPSNFYDKAGTYDISLFVTDSWGCSDSGTQTIVVFPPPLIAASTDTIICVGDAATLTGYGGVSYTWEPSSTVSCNPCNPAFASPLVVTTYTVTGKDKYGCANTDTVTVRLKTHTVSSGHGDTTICQGVVVPLFDSGATKFTWIPAAGLSDSHIADPLASPDATTTYTVIAQLGSCIPDTNYITVTIHPVPTVDAGIDQTIVAGASAEIRAAGSNINSISWGKDSTLSCNNCPNPTARPFQTTTYVIDVTSSFGCPASDSVTINVYCDKGQIFIPNTFTPNGDGENDVFYPRGRGISLVKSFRVYNRWGQMMFERTNIAINDAANAWDGSFAGDLPRPDVYVYVVEAICEAGDPVNIKGDVTIIR